MNGHTSLALTDDGSLVLGGSVRNIERVHDWIPRNHRRAAMVSDTGVACIELSSASEAAAFRGATTLTLGTIDASRDGDRVHLRGAVGWMGDVDLAGLQATIRVADGDVPVRETETWAALTLAAAFLIGRLGGALVHAAAAVDPDGRSWLLVGDTHSGKTTTCASLTAAGWQYLADDQVVLRVVDGVVIAEGWPRLAHLDTGWAARTPHGDRRAVDLDQLFPAQRCNAAPLGGLAFPVVLANQQTQARPIVPAEALSRLIRQSPWLLADDSAAAKGLGLLACACSLPAFSLSLGRDSYARGEVIAAALGCQVPA